MGLDEGTKPQRLGKRSDGEGPAQARETLGKRLVSLKGSGSFPSLTEAWLTVCICSFVGLFAHVLPVVARAAVGLHAQVIAAVHVGSRTGPSLASVWPHSPSRSAAATDTKLARWGQRQLD